MFQLNPINSDIRKELHFREASIAKTVLHSAKDPQTGKANEQAATFYPLGTIWIKMTSPVEEGIVMLGGVTLNGEQVYQQAQEDIEKLEREVRESYDLPVDYMIGLKILCQQMSILIGAERTLKKDSMRI